ncbi:MAG: ABC transporter ATP-binding protein [Pseudomonadota bacterium]
MSMIEIENFRLAFDGFEGRAHVLDGIDIRIEAGESVGIVGESGCGKSVLARSLLRLNPSPPARVVSGAIRFEGQDVLAMDRAALRRLRGGTIGMVFQDPVTYLNPVFTIGRQMEEVLRAHEPQLSRAARRDRCVELLEAVRLPQAGALLGRYPHELSGGMRQRVLIAEALAGKPRVLIADEPTTALDVTIQRQVLELIADLVERLGLTLVLISHDLGVIGAVCRRILVMYAGHVVEDAPAEELFRAPRHPYTRGLLAAMPDLRRPGHMPSGIPGSIPDLRTPPTGCRFHPRCMMAEAVCRATKPVLLGGDGHAVACHMAHVPA